MEPATVHARITPQSSLGVLSHYEIARLKDTSQGGLHRMFRQCSLAVLTAGGETDDTKLLLEKFRHFDIQVISQDRGIKLEVFNAPANAFVDGDMIESVKENLFAVLRDIIFISGEMASSGLFDLNTSEGITNAVFHMLRNAGVLKPMMNPNRVVCWGGHSIGRVEYDYSKEVGHQCGLRGMNIVTGCGPGAMKGPMKGARVGHAKQCIDNSEFIGITEPGIIAAEAPNPVVNKLVIMPDIEKRLEAFVRVAHGIVVFPGGVGTAEEILYMLGILLHPENAEIPFPLVFTGPTGSENYFEKIDTFLAEALGPKVRERYRIIVNDPKEVALAMRYGIKQVRHFRKDRSDAYYYNWSLKIPLEMQLPFDPTHENMGTLRLFRDRPSHELAYELRRAFSGIVSGNVKEEGINRIELLGPFTIHGDVTLMAQLDELLRSFVDQGRMKVNGKQYFPCYVLKPSV